MDTLEHLKKIMPLSQIEAECGMPKRTLKAGRGLPKKYKQAVNDLHNKLVGKPATLKTTTYTKEIDGDLYTIKNGVVGIQDEHIFRRVILNDGNVIIKRV